MSGRGEGTFRDGEGLICGAPPTLRQYLRLLGK